MVDLGLKSASGPGPRSCVGLFCLATLLGGQQRSCQHGGRVAQDPGVAQVRQEAEGGGAGERPAEAYRTSAPNVPAPAESKRRNCDLTGPLAKLGSGPPDKAPASCLV